MHVSVMQSFQYFRSSIQTIHAFGTQFVFTTISHSVVHVSICACVQATRNFSRGQLRSSPEWLRVQDPALAVSMPTTEQVDVVQ